MDINKVVQYRLFPEEHRKIPRKEHYKMVWVNNSNYFDYQDELEGVIQLLHAQLDWDGIPTFDNLIQRFEANSFCILFYYKDECIGWNWGNPNVTIDWTKTHTPLQKNECYLGGCFVSNLVDRPADAGICNYNMFFDEVIKSGYGPLYGYCDDWNRVAIRINLANGWKPHDFLLVT